MRKQPDHKQLLRAALFVDFDNIYLSLAQQDNFIATRFATNPDLWLAWLEQQMTCSYLGDDAISRRILIRRCYLNPYAFSSFRPYFIRSAFEVVDCPPLTSRGKTSTDIHMVMDILEAVNHDTFFDEFIILSGDADFTPVLLRLRKHDRRSVVLAAGYASPAYKAACDYLIDADTFIKTAIGVSDQEDELEMPLLERAINGVSASLLAKMAARLYSAANVPQGVQASELPAIYKEFPEFKQSEHWLGFYSLRRLTEAIVSRRDDLEILEEDPWRVVVGKGSSFPAGQVEATDLPARQELKQEIAEYIRDIVERSDAAVPMATLAQAVNRQFSQFLPDTNWFGAGSFKNLLRDLDLGEVMTTSITPGYVFDPERHEAPHAEAGLEQKEYASLIAARRADEFSSKYPILAPLAQKIHQLTDTPYLAPEHYALLLEELAREVNQRGYQMTRTSKTVRDRCVEKGAPVARSHVNFVLIGIYSTGYRLGADGLETAEKLGLTLVADVLNLCRTAQLELSEQEVSQVKEWIMGAMEADKTKVS